MTLRVRLLATSGQTESEISAGRAGDRFANTKIDRFATLALRETSRLSGFAADVPPDRVGVYIGNAFAGWGYGEGQLANLVASGPQAVHAYQATAWFPAAAQGEVTIRNGWRGCSKTFSGVHCPFAEALLAAAIAVADGRLDVVFVGAAESCAAPFVSRVIDGAPDEGAFFVVIMNPSVAAGIPLELELRAGSGSAAPSVLEWPVLLSRHFRRLLISRVGFGLPIGQGLALFVQQGADMPQRRQSITVDANASECFELCAEVGRWPTYMPAVRQARRIEGDDSDEVVEITAEAGSELLTWRSRRQMDRERLRIWFERLDPAPPFTRLHGEWTFVEDGAGAAIVLEHTFDLVSPDVAVHAEAIISSNVTRDLEGMKAFLERR